MSYQLLTGSYQRMPNPLEELRFNILKSQAGNEIIDPITMKMRLKDAALGLGTTLLGDLLIRAVARKAIPMKTQINLKKMMYPKKTITEGIKLFGSPKDIASSAIFGTIGGLYNKDIKNAIARANIDKSKKAEAMALMKRVDEYKAGKPPSFSKTSGLGSATWGIAKSVGRLGKASAGGLLLGAPLGGNRLGRNLLGGGKTGLSQHVFGMGVKGAVGVGGYHAAKGIGTAVRNARTPHKTNYNSMLRNNMLAGNISPSELSREDMASVNRLGTR